MDDAVGRELERIERSFDEAISAASDLQDVARIRSRFLGRKGELASLIKGLGKMPPQRRREAGSLMNSLKTRLEEELEVASARIEEKKRAESLASQRLDVTLPGRRPELGRSHPVSQVMEEIEDIFHGLGFETAEGPEVEHDYYNFEALNIPKEHPARDMQDTFYIARDLLLRTHTSPVQIRIMEQRRPPLRVIAPGTVYRRDSDLTHTPMFHQVEGFMVDDGITFGDLKGVLTLFLHRLFDADVELRFRPSYFPFVEPGAEVDIRCVICRGSGCRTCKSTGWIEILGAGMIHPRVFTSVGYDPEEYAGFAFGLGIERIAMLKFGIDDIRLFFENDLRFLKQF
ncbi:MAG TPA: phenylalanine--tRNA ligase subunit alpha [Deltaproteobacteria bacterium]|nr:phenylalanine--tRNA ligase subunit alpha [Deltaproteobacteria bacterium]